MFDEIYATLFLESYALDFERTSFRMGEVCFKSKMVKLFFEGPTHLSHNPGLFIVGKASLKMPTNPLAEINPKFLSSLVNALMPVDIARNLLPL
jgi:hypothetical protein